MVAEEFPACRLVRREANGGFAAANNDGIALTTGAAVLLLNSDTVVFDDSLSRCQRHLNNYMTLGAVSPRLIGVDGRPQRCLHQFPTLAARVRQAWRRPRAPDAATGWLAGTALMVRREALDAVGGRLDQGYFMYWEDADLSAKLLSKGWAVEVVEDACIRHYGGASGGGPDAARRGDLHAWYAWGEHRWFRQNRGFHQAAALWLLDAFDVVRKVLRGLRRRQAPERMHARALAQALRCRLFGRRPPNPA